MTDRSRRLKSRLSRRYAYRAAVFVLASGWLLVLVFTARYGRAEITVRAASRQTGGDFIVTVQDVPASVAVADASVVPGKIVATRLKKQQTFAATGPAVTGTAAAAGSVTIFNTTGRGQTLVATTRLLDPRRQLVRLRERVVVPAGGQVTATVSVDSRENFSAVAPKTRLTIPGLAPPLQAVIYGEAKTALPAGGTSVATVTESDLVTAAATLGDRISREAQEAFLAQLEPRERRYTQVIEREVLHSSADAAVGEARETFTAEAELNIVTVAIDEARLIAAVEKHLTMQLPFTHALQAVDPASLQYEVQRYDQNRREATLKVTAQATTSLRPGSPMLQPVTVAGLTKAQIITLLQRYQEIKQVEVRFFPSHLRRAPRLPDRIRFMVE